MPRRAVTSHKRHAGVHVIRAVRATKATRAFRRSKGQDAKSARSADILRPPVLCGAVSHYAVQLEWR
eukprot:7226274-Alexandrium_andersonii.AAC.1